MKCRVCGQTAAINLYQHRIAFCGPHYQDWFVKQTADTIVKYQMLTPGERVLVAVSGGKDSLALWDVLNKLGYAAEGLYIHLGIEGPNGYSHRSAELCEHFATERNLILHQYNLPEEIGSTIPDLLQSKRHGSDKPCSICGLIKRRVFNTFPRSLQIPVLATGHNLDDEVSVLFTNNLSWNMEQLQRQSPVLEGGNGFTRKIKPLFRFYERETAAYTLIAGIEYIEEECPFAVGSTTNSNKMILNAMEEKHPGMKMNYYTQFLKQRKAGFLGVPENQTLELNVCPTCGELTTNPGECGYCKLLKKRDHAVSR
jgi:uncharacterized protein (TIGR00269 family)